LCERLRVRGYDTTIFIHLGATQHPFKLHPSLRLIAQFLHERRDRLPRRNDPRHAPDRESRPEHHHLTLRPRRISSRNTIDEREQLAPVAHDSVEPLRDRHVFPSACLLRAPHPSSERLRQLILPPDDGKPQRDLAPSAVGLSCELLRRLVQQVAHPRGLPLFRRERGLRRGELRVQRGRRGCVPRCECLERFL
jgi:hypothetical protein